MGITWSRPEAIRDGGLYPSVTLSQMEDLITHARLAGAPDDAQLKVDVVPEFASPIKVHRATFHWDG
jgi:hypothetical protein